MFREQHPRYTRNARYRLVQLRNVRPKLVPDGFAISRELPYDIRRCDGPNQIRVGEYIVYDCGGGIDNIGLQLMPESDTGYVEDRSRIQKEQRARMSDHGGDKFPACNRFS
jgi:hypothetical protein